MTGDCKGVLAKDTEASVDDLEDLFPIKLVVCMNGEISEANGLAESEARLIRDDAFGSENGKHLSHDFGWRDGETCDDVGADIDRNLDGTFQIYTNDILEIDVSREAFNRWRAFFLYPFHASGERIELPHDDVTIHGLRR